MKNRFRWGGRAWVLAVCALGAIGSALTLLGRKQDPGQGQVSCEASVAADGKGVGLPVGMAGAMADSIERIASGYPAEIGVAVIVDNADTVIAGNRAVYPMMSVFKLHQALAVCRNLDRQGVSLDSVMRFRREELDPNTWSPMLSEHAETEIALPIGELLRYTLIQSDNNASNLMFERLAGTAETDSFVSTLIPRESFRIAYTEAEMSKDHSRAYANYTSPLGAAMLINRLFNTEIVSAEKQAFVKRALGECKTGRDRLAVPLEGRPGVTLAHKTGSGYTNEAGVLMAHNDVGYVELPDGRHYAIAVFVKDIHGNEAMASEAIARISAAVFAMIQKT